MTIEEVLRRLALQDESLIAHTLAMRREPTQPCWLHERTQAIARLSALIALDAAVVSYQSAVIDALAAGVTADEILGALIAVAPLVGLARVTSAAPAIAAALGYDLDEAFERLDRGATETG